MKLAVPPATSGLFRMMLVAIAIHFRQEVSLRLSRDSRRKHRRAASQGGTQPVQGHSALRGSVTLAEIKDLLLFFKLRSGAIFLAF